MQISISDDITRGFKSQKINDLDELLSYITEYNWSCGTFKDGHRSTKNFQYADVIALDFDEGMTIDEAAEAFKGYKCVIAPSRNHRKEKNGKIADRFRVVIPLSEPITNYKDFKATWKSLHKKFSMIDEACSDASRLWYPCQKEGARRFWKGNVVEKQTSNDDSVNLVETKIGIKGNLTSKSLDFICNGAPKGSWNQTLLNVAMDLRSQGWGHHEAINILKLATRKELGNDGDLSDQDHKTIEQAYNYKEGHEKRGVDDCFDFRPASKILKECKPVEWLVGDLLPKAGTSVIAGAPKSGKSTISRQLCIAVAQGGEFLNRKVSKGKVLYLALEEQANILANQLKKQGLQDKDELLIHSGHVNTADKFTALDNLIKAQSPAILVIDTLILFAGVQDINSYNETYTNMGRFNEIARQNNCHILFIHHQNKSDKFGMNTIMGSSAIHASVDVAMIFSNFKGTRYLTTEQRAGIPFNNQALEFYNGTQTYKTTTITKKRGI